MWKELHREGRKKYLPPPAQVALWKYVRQRQEQQYLNASDPKHTPSGAASIIPCRTDPGFGYSSGDPSGSPSDKPIKDTFPVQVIYPPSVPMETPTKHPSPVPK